MDTKFTVNVNRIEDAKAFVQSMMFLDGSVDAGNGSYIVDASSVLGVLSLDLSKPITVTLHSDKQSVIDQFTEICKKYE